LNPRLPAWQGAVLCWVDSAARTRSSTLSSRLPYVFATGNGAHEVLGQGRLRQGAGIGYAAQTQGCLHDRVLEPCPFDSTGRTRSSTLPSRLLRKGATDAKRMWVWGRGGWGRGQAMGDVAQTQVIPYVG
jgi:hypothetical protein